MSRLLRVLTASVVGAFMNSLPFLLLVAALCCAVLALLVPWSPIVTPMLAVLCLVALIASEMVHDRWSR
jgi:hypothetical protein